VLEKCVVNRDWGLADRSMGTNWLRWPGNCRTLFVSLDVHWKTVSDHLWSRRSLTSLSPSAVKSYGVLWNEKLCFILLRVNCWTPEEAEWKQGG
jgi:hypothetical protein